MQVSTGSVSDICRSGPHVVAWSARAKILLSMGKRGREYLLRTDLLFLGGRMSLELSRDRRGEFF